MTVALPVGWVRADLKSEKINWACFPLQQSETKWLLNISFGYIGDRYCRHTHLLSIWL
jgi:hypothetical protein